MDSHIFNVIIITDRLAMQAESLIAFIKDSKDFNLLGIAHTADQAMELVDRTVDYLIFAGYQRNRANYSVVEKLKNAGQRFVPVMWAMQDDFIAATCREQNIPYRFERRLPLDQFVNYLISLEGHYWEDML